MLGLDTVESVAHVIQVALTPVFLLSESRPSLASFRHGSRVWPIASTRWLINWKAMNRSIDENYGAGWPTSDDGPTCSTPP
jgi:hypothetical protein